MFKIKEVVFSIVTLLLLFIVIFSSAISELDEPSLSPRIPVSAACSDSFDGLTLGVIKCDNSFEDDCSRNACILTLLENPINKCCTDLEGDAGQCNSIKDKYLEFSMLNRNCKY